MPHDTVVDEILAKLERARREAEESEAEASRRGFDDLVSTRGFINFDDVAKGIEKIGKDIKSGVEDAVDVVKNTVEGAVRTGVQGAEYIARGIEYTEANRDLILAASKAVASISSDPQGLQLISALSEVFVPSWTSNPDFTAIHKIYESSHLAELRASVAERNERSGQKSCIYIGLNKALSVFVGADATTLNIGIVEGRPSDWRGPYISLGMNLPIIVVSAGLTMVFTPGASECNAIFVSAGVALGFDTGLPIVGGGHTWVFPEDAEAAAGNR